MMQKSKYTLLNFCSIAYFFAILICDAMKGLNIVALYGIMALWIFLCFFKSNRSFKITFSSKVFKYIAFYCLILFFTSYIGAGVGAAFKFPLAFLNIAMPILIFNYYQVYDKRISSLFMRIMLPILLILSSYGAYIQYLHPELGRYITAGEYSGDDLVFGGVEVASASAAFAVFLIYLLKSASRTLGKFEKIFFILLLISQLLIVLTSGSTISTIFMILFIAATFIPSKNRKIFFYLIISIIFIIIVFREQIGNALIDFGNSLTDATSSDRYRSLGAALVYGDKVADSEYFFDRFGKPMLSLGTFLEHPFFGVAYKYGNDWGLALKYGVGNHSEWTDVLARFGIFGLVYFNIFKSQLKRLYGTVSHLFISAWFCLGIFNPVVSTYSNLIFFFVTPYLFNKYLVDEK